MSSPAEPGTKLKVYRQTVEIVKTPNHQSGLTHNFLNFTSEELNMDADTDSSCPEDEKENLAVALMRPRRAARVPGADLTNAQATDLVVKKTKTLKPADLTIAQTTDVVVKKTKTLKPAAKTIASKGEDANGHSKTTQTMILEAIHTLGNEKTRKRISVPAIKNWIRATYPEINPLRLGKIFKKTMASAVESEMVIMYPRPKPESEDTKIPPSVLMCRYKLNTQLVQIEDNVVKIKKPKKDEKTTTAVKKVTKVGETTAAIRKVKKVGKTAAAVNKVTKVGEAKAAVRKVMKVGKNAAAVKQATKVGKTMKPKPKSATQALSTSIIKAAKKTLNGPAVKKSTVSKPKPLSAAGAPSPLTPVIKATKKKNVTSSNEEPKPKKAKVDTKKSEPKKVAATKKSILQKIICTPTALKKRPAGALAKKRVAGAAASRGKKE